MKKELKENVQADLDIARGAMKEIIQHNRFINKNLMTSFEDGDYSLLEEFGITTKCVLDAAKLLTEINAQTPKTIKSIEQIQEEKKKIDLDSLMSEE